MNNCPLVSVFVITYNSASYIKETLDSVKRQTYKNIELIISDDCSTDDTVEICRTWLMENKDSFVRAELVSTPHNMGVAGNCNNAIRATTGVWLKGLSGDDKFLDYTIAEYVNYVNEHPKCRICFAKLHFWGDDSELVKNVSKGYEKFYYPFIKEEWKSQYKQILRRTFVPGVGLFFQKSLWEEIGGYDERYPFCEEHPFTYNVLAAKNRIYFIDKELYGYQIRAGSLCRDSKHQGNLGNEKTFDSASRYFFECRRKNMIKNGYLLSAWHESIEFYNQSLLYKEVSKTKIILGRILFFFSPLAYYVHLKNLLCKNKG